MFFRVAFFFFSNITWKFRLCSSGHVLARRVMARCGHSFCLWVNTLLLSGDPKFIEMFASFQLSFWSEICPGPQQFRAIFQKNKNFKKVCFVTSNSLDDENPESKSETEAINGSPLGEGIARYYPKARIFHKHLLKGGSLERKSSTSLLMSSRSTCPQGGLVGWVVCFKALMLFPSRLIYVLLELSEALNV